MTVPEHRDTYIKIYIIIDIMRAFHKSMEITPGGQWETVQNIQQCQFQISAGLVFSVCTPCIFYVFLFMFLFLLKIFLMCICVPYLIYIYLMLSF